MMRTLTVTRYVRPLREGGSLPAIVEASHLRLYVMELFGAGEVRARGLPEVSLGLDAKFRRNQPRDETQDDLLTEHRAP